MKLVSFSVENYRNITTARQISLSDYSLLVGANNEGKSNLLHALSIAMNGLVDWFKGLQRTTGGELFRPQPNLLIRRAGRINYDWDTDFPVSKQEAATPNSTSDITLEFELSDNEVLTFTEKFHRNPNGTLSLLVSFGQREFEVAVKTAPGQKGFSKLSTAISIFVSKRIRFVYIPAIRTAKTASQVTSKLLERELLRLQDNSEYSAALMKIETILNPVLDGLAEVIHSTVASFLPSVKSVELKSQRDKLYRALHQSVEIIVHDGQQTKLERKGDGVQSLVALAMMRHASLKYADDVSTVIAIEEPEAHLHPKAVHELRRVLNSLASNNQVVLTSHSPLFVNPGNLRSTIIVKSSTASPADHVSEVRNALGVRFSDNLINARLMLLVEGPNDEIAMKAIISERSNLLRDALANGTTAFDHLCGASALAQKASFYRAGACLMQCFIDDDKDGKSALQKATDSKVIDTRDVNLCKVPNLPEAELEDLYDRSVYGPAFLKEFGVDPIAKPMSCKKRKWSNVMGGLFRQSGKQWDDNMKAQVKAWLAIFASENASTILKQQLVGPIDSFIKTAESKLSQD